MKTQIIIDLAQIAQDNGLKPSEVEFVMKNPFQRPAIQTSTADMIANTAGLFAQGYDIQTKPNLIVCESQGPRPTRELDFEDCTVFQNNLDNPKRIRNYNGGETTVYAVKFGFSATEEKEEQIKRATRCAYDDYKGSKPLPKFEWMRLDMRDGAYFGYPEMNVISATMSREPIVACRYPFDMIRQNAKANIKGYVTAMPPTSTKQAKFVYIVKEIEIL